MKPAAHLVFDLVIFLVHTRTCYFSSAGHIGAKETGDRVVRGGVFVLSQCFV